VGAVGRSYIETIKNEQPANLDNLERLNTFIVLHLLYYYNINFDKMLQISKSKLHNRYICIDTKKMKWYSESINNRYDSGMKLSDFQIQLLGLKVSMLQGFHCTKEGLIVEEV